MKFYNYSLATKFRNLFSDRFLKKLCITNDQLTHVVFKRGKRVHMEFIRSVFTTYLKAVIQDCIDNNTKFISPGRHWFSIYVAPVTKKNLERIIKTKGVYESVDLIKSDFQIYEFLFHSPYLPKGKNKRRIRINNPKYQEIVQKVNNGFRYGNHGTRHYTYYFKEVRKEFPMLSHIQIDLIIREACYQIHYSITEMNKDVLLKNSYHKFSMTFFDYVSMGKIKYKNGAK